MAQRRAVIFVADMSRMTAFYRDGLGLRVVDETRRDGWVELEEAGRVWTSAGCPVVYAGAISRHRPCCVSIGAINLELLELTLVLTGDADARTIARLTEAVPGVRFAPPE